MSKNWEINDESLDFSAKTPLGGGLGKTPRNSAVTDQSFQPFMAVTYLCLITEKTVITIGDLDIIIYHHNYYWILLVIYW